MDNPRTTYFAVLICSGLWCALLLAAPLLRSADLPVSSALYSAFSHVCHQFSDRSFHVGGEPIAVCVRCSVLYFGFFASLIVYPFLARRRSRLQDVRVLAVAFLPMAIDVGLNMFGLSQSTAETRALTGLLAGVALPFFVLPPLQDAVRQFSAQRGDSTYAGKTQ